MNLEQEWKRLNEARFSPDTPTSLTVSDLMRDPQKSPLAILRRNARINMGFAGVFTIGFCALFAFFHHPYIRISLGILIAVYLAGVFFTAQRLQRLPAQPDMSGPLLPVMKSYHEQLRSWINWQQGVALFIYPVAAIAGYLLSLATRGDVDVLLQNTHNLWTLAIGMIVAIPVGHWLAGRMSKAAFGKYLDQLKANIEALETADDKLG